MPADSEAYKMQGPDSAGNALPTFPASPGATGGPPSALIQTGNAANATVAFSFTAVAGKTNYVTSLLLCCGGATAGSIIDITLVGVSGSTVHIPYPVPTGATVANLPVQLNFNPPLAATAPNTAINFSMPAAGAGNTNQSATMVGFIQ
jgi:hypothetical protein